MYSACVCMYEGACDIERRWCRPWAKQDNGMSNLKDTCPPGSAGATLPVPVRVCHSSVVDTPTPVNRQEDCYRHLA